MDDGEHLAKTGRNLFKDFSSVAQSTGTYTGHDYVNIMEFLIKHWEISSMQGLSVEAQKAQEDLMNLLPRFKKLTERQANITKKKTPVGSPFSWIFNKEVGIIA
jgi:acyl-[acyl-carrier-protein] desaturase